jgi:hypothetical protein
MVLAEIAYILSLSRKKPTYLDSRSETGSKMDRAYRCKLFSHMVVYFFEAVVPCFILSSC